VVDLGVASVTATGEVYNLTAHEKFEGNYVAGEAGAVLGGGAVAGGRVWDRQYKFRLRIGPLTFAQYEAFLPGGPLLAKLVDWVRLYVNFELEWDVRLLLAGGETPALRLGRAGRLGWTTWVGQRPADRDADDLCLNAEAFVGRREAIPV
jgi:type VI secretion system protein ImpH